jgi:hypothetical protein
VNWPIRGWHKHSGWFGNPKVLLTVILLLVFSTGCNGIPADQFAIPGIGNGIPDPVFNEPTSTSNPIISTATQDFTVTGTITPSPDPATCNIAIAGNPLDVSIPDGTILDPGEEFIKIWRIQNAGSCVWSTDYTINWFSGDALGINNHVEIINAIYPGEIVEIAVDMLAPADEGVYQSNWKICDPGNFCFGLGPNGAYPFWARIQVRQVVTSTPSAMPSQTPTSIVLLKGVTELISGNAFDLDKGRGGIALEADIQFLALETGWGIHPMNQAKIAYFGRGNPTENQCLTMLYLSESIPLETMDTSSALCYKSTQGLPGYLKVNRMDLENQKIEIEYLTWYAP